ncbi:MAG: DUF1573 domain-containing protein [Sedimentisphaerales bacterium]|nr:DUF1573 domain-containing protein [Sedimentisphaerales bacterium]
MKRISLILALLGIGSILLFQAGCRKAEKSAQESKPVVQTPPKTVAVAKPAPEPVKAKPEPAKPVPAPAKPEPVSEPPKPEAVVPKAAVQEAAATAEPNASGPRIKFDNLIHDFGDMDPDSSNVCEFGFKNVGDALLKILNVKTDCGCTVFTLEKKEYAPGESGTLKIKYHSVARGGAVTRRTVVTSNDPIEPNVTLTMKGKVVERIAYEPTKLNLLLKGGDQAPPTVTLTSLDGKPFSIKGVKASANAISAEFDPAVEATKFVLQLKVDKEQLQKISNGIVEIELTHPAAKSVTIPFSALTRFKLNPPTIILFDAEPGKPIVRDGITVLNNYQENFEIESVNSKEGITKVVKKEQISNGYMFSLQITPPDSAGTQRFSDEISIQIKDGELLKIKCQGFYTRKKK